MKSDRFCKKLIMMILLFLLAGCMTTQERLLDVETSQVQLRSIQSRVLDIADKEKTMRAVIATLQDLGFMLDRVDYTLGVVTASKSRSDVFQPHAIGSLRMTVTVRQRGEKQLLVRANIEYQLRPVTEPKPYQNFFNSLEKAMFLEAHQIE